MLIPIKKLTKLLPPGVIIFRLNVPKFDFGSDPAGGAYSAPTDPLAGGEGASRPLPKNPTPLSALRASSFGLSGLASSPHFLDRGYAYARGVYTKTAHEPKRPTRRTWRFCLGKYSSDSSGFRFPDPLCLPYLHTLSIRH